MNQAVIPNQTYGENMQGDNQGISAETVKTLDEALGGTADGKSTSETVMEGLAATVGSVSEEFETKKAELVSQYGAIAGKYQDAMEAGERVNQELTAYDLQSYIDDRETEGIVDSMLSNNQEMAGRVSDYVSSYDSYVSDVYKAAGENTTAMQESVAEAEEKSKQLLEKGLADAKVSRNESSVRNQELLGGSRLDFSSSRWDYRCGNLWTWEAQE